MSEQIYALLVEANPVPDPDGLNPAPVVTVGHPHEPRSTTMQTDLRTPVSQPLERRRWTLALVAAAVVIAGLGVTAGVLGGVPRETADARERAAVETVEMYFDAMHGGNAALMAAMVAPDGSAPEIDRNRFEHHVVVNATYPWVLRRCEAVSTTDDRVRVECHVTNTDPVYVAQGVSELVAPFDVHDDGHIELWSWQGANFEYANIAYAEYLRATDREAYDAACNQAFYEPGTAVNANGIVLTARCAELTVEVAEDVARWVEAGKP